MAAFRFLQHYIRLFNSIFTDKSLTKKASLNAITSTLAYGSQMIVGLFITPFMVAGLGNYTYGVWQILNRFVGYLSPVGGRSMEVIKWTLANKQASDDYDLKRRYVGCSIAIWLFFLPLIGIGGVVLIWFIPGWLKSPLELAGQIQLTTFLLLINLIVLNIAALPQNVLQGENLGYKRLGMAPLLTILGGILTWLALHYQTGIVGVVTVALLISVLSFIFYLNIVKRNVNWFGIKRPSIKEVREFFKLSLLFIAWDIILNLMIASDVVVLGILKSAESVTSYTLTKYAPETIVSLIAIIVFGIAPGLGRIIGSGELRKAAHVRGEIMTITWLVMTTIGTSILIFNRVFLALWVGEQQYSGPLTNLLIILAVAQFVLIRVDANIIDLTLIIKQKVWLGALSVTLSLALSIWLVGYANLGALGVLIGLISGRFLLSVSYPLLVGKALKIPPSEQVFKLVRPIITTISLLSLAYIFDSVNILQLPDSLPGWIMFLFLAGLTAAICLITAYYLGLSSAQRSRLLQRVRMIFGNTFVE